MRTPELAIHTIVDSCFRLISLGGQTDVTHLRKMHATLSEEYGDDKEEIEPILKILEILMEAID